MSTIYVTKRICDVCNKEYGTPELAWMTITAPNMGEDAPVFDFCGWDCLFTWVTTQDDEDEQENPNGEIDTHEESVAALAGQLNEVIANPQSAQQPAPRPAMSLADAIATGALSPGMRVQS